MKHGELSNFTYAELSNLTHEQLSLGKLETLEQISGNKQIPKEIIDKLYQMCYEIIKTTGDSSISLPTDKKKLTLNKAITFMKFVITLDSFANDLYKIIQELCDYFNLC